MSVKRAAAEGATRYAKNMVKEEVDQATGEPGRKVVARAVTAKK